MSARSKSEGSASNRPASTVNHSTELLAALDPIHAAIERHRAAHLAHLVVARVQATTPDVGPNHEPVAAAAAKAAVMKTSHAAERASFALLATTPTTLAGLSALLAYVDDFNAGRVALPNRRSLGWHSCPESWPTLPTDHSDGGTGFAFAFLKVANTVIRAHLGADK